MRWLRRWWARITHKHDWVVIHRMNIIGSSRCPVFGSIGERVKWTRPSVLKRCHCGTEKAEMWDQERWVPLDLEFINDQIARQNIDIPARHQE